MALEQVFVNFLWTEDRRWIRAWWHTPGILALMWKQEGWRAKVSLATGDLKAFVIYSRCPTSYFPKLTILCFVPELF